MGRSTRTPAAPPAPESTEPGEPRPDDAERSDDPSGDPSPEHAGAAGFVDAW